MSKQAEKVDIQNSLIGAVVGWIILALVSVGVMAFCFYLYPFFDQMDPDAPVMAVLISTPKMVNGLMYLTLGAILVNLITKGDWFAKIYESPGACAAVVSALFAAMAWIASIG